MTNNRDSLKTPKRHAELASMPHRHHLNGATFSNALRQRADDTKAASHQNDRFIQLRTYLSYHPNHEVPLHIPRRRRPNTEDTSVVWTIPFPTNGNNGNEGEEEETTLIKTVGWISAGLGAVALGLFIGRELRQRYQFNRRTPYDFYAHSGDEQDVDFGLGI